MKYAIDSSFQPRANTAAALSNFAYTNALFENLQDTRSLGVSSTNRLKYGLL